MKIRFRKLHLVPIALLFTCQEHPEGDVAHTSAPVLHEPRSVELRVTPGKPGAPTEIVRVSEIAEAGDFRRRLDLERVAEDGTSLGNEQVELEAEDVEAVWRAARDVSPWDQADLLLGGAAEEVADFGARSVALTLGRTGGNRVHLELQWSRPLPDDPRARSLRNLTRALAAVARRRGQTLRLHYLPR